MFAQYNLIPIFSPGVYIPLLLLWGVTQNAMALFFSKFFSNSSRATLFGLLFSLATTIISSILCTVQAVSMPAFYFMIFPPYAFVRTFFYVMLAYVHMVPPVPSDYVICFAYLTGMTILLFLLSSSRVLELPFYVYTKIGELVIRVANRNKRDAYDDQFVEDEDCIKERERIAMANIPDNSVMVIQNLHKNFYSFAGTTHAVNDLNLTFVDNEVQQLTRLTFGIGVWFAWTKWCG